MIKVHFRIIFLNLIRLFYLSVKGNARQVVSIIEQTVFDKSYVVGNGYIRQATAIFERHIARKYAIHFSIRLHFKKNVI